MRLPEPGSAMDRLLVAAIVVLVIALTLLVLLAT